MKNNEGIGVGWVWCYDKGEEWNISGADPYVHKSVAQVHLSQKNGPNGGLEFVILESRQQSVSTN